MGTRLSAANLRFFAHPKALVESAEIGPRTRIWAFAHVLAGARVGADCNVCDHTFLENGVRVGDRVTIKCGVQLWDGVTLEDDVFVGPNATFTNDPFPRSRRHPAQLARTLVRRGASIGANATILPGVTIGPEAMIGAGAVVTRDVPARAIVVGNPGYVTGYAGSQKEGRPHEVPARCGSKTLAGGSRLLDLPRVTDPRGHLTFAEVDQSLPFAAVRTFVVFGVPSREIRGEHAHRSLHQFLMCVAGSCSVRMFDGERGDEVVLDRPDLGLHVPPLVWTTQYKYSADAVLVVLASEVYAEADYIRGFDEFLALVGHRPEAECAHCG
jgi:UDP-2-acetamido-3-amino-2,3-dideoxy-glucuronate N-acetyltransferase